MKRLLFILSLFVAATPWIAAQDATAEDLKRATEYLAKTRAAFLKSTENLSEAQWNFKPAPERWSVAQVSEHIAAAEDALMEMVQGQVMKAPARSEPADVKELDDLVLTALPDRSHKFQAPEPLVPTQRYGSPEKTIEHFKASRAKTVEFLTHTKDLRGHAVDSPLGKKLDGLEWILFIGAHSERHTKQIEEVKADPHFPKA